MRALDKPTPGYLVNLVLDEEVYHGNDGGKEPKRIYEGLTINLELSGQTL